MRSDIAAGVRRGARWGVLVGLVLGTRRAIRELRRSLARLEEDTRKNQRSVKALRFRYEGHEHDLPDPGHWPSQRRTVGLVDR